MRRSTWEAWRARALRSLRPKKRVLRQVRYRGRDLVVFANEDVGWRIIARGSYERTQEDALMSCVKSGDRFLDIGANIGVYSVLLAQAAPDVVGVAFEPIELNRRLLELNLTLNRVTGVEVRGGVLGETRGEATLSVSTDGAYSSLIPTERKDEARKVRVRMSTVDDSFPEDAVDVVKLDVEGAELAVLRGAQGLLEDQRRRPRALLVEVCEENVQSYGHSSEDVVTFLTDRGYRAHPIAGGRIHEEWSSGMRPNDVLFVAPERVEIGPNPSGTGLAVVAV